MITQFNQFVKSLNKPKYYLILANILLVFFAILLTNLGILPFKRIGDFAFFAVIGLLLALYRPSWLFLFFVGTVALENINVGPADFPFAIRPYQFFGSVTILAIIIRYVFGRLGFKLIKFKWLDYLLMIFTAASFISALLSENRGASLKQSVILLSFIFLYYLVRNYVQTFNDLKKILPFFVSSSVIIIFYGIWQNIRSAHELPAFEVMPGRPNATFTEPDWLGIFIVFSITAIYSLIYATIKNHNIEFKVQNSKFKITIKSLKLLFLYLYLILNYVILLLTVSRSAWLGAAIVTLIYLKIILTNLKWKPKEWQWKKFLSKLQYLAISIICSIGIVYIFNLTSFQLFNRAGSTGTGLQKITISCRDKITLPDRIETSEELIRFNCRHINLEEIPLEESRGYYIREINRPDPNVNIRKEIYQKSISAIKNNPAFGTGWGSIGPMLGTDERGTSLNSSNIFLEVWLGSGIIGFLAFATFLGYILVSNLKNLFTEENRNITLNVLIILAFWGLLIPNLFNAGIFLGILWLFLALSQIQNKEVVKSGFMPK